MSEIEATMITDLIAAQAELSAITLKKTGTNPGFRNSRYIPLEELIDEVIPVLNKHGLALVQKPAIKDGAPTLVYELIHKSGSRIGGEMLLMSPTDNPQGQGSAITYARRYSLMSLLGIAADPDDDGNAASRPPRQEAPAAARTPQPAPRNGSPMASEQQVKMIRAIGQKLDGEVRDALFQRHCPAEAFDEEGKLHPSRLTVGQASALIMQLKKAEETGGVPMV